MCCLCLLEFENSICNNNNRPRCLSFSMFICMNKFNYNERKKNINLNYYDAFNKKRNSINSSSINDHRMPNASQNFFFPSKKKKTKAILQSLSSNHEFVATQQVFVTTAHYLPTGKHVSFFRFWVGLSDKWIGTLEFVQYELHRKHLNKKKSISLFWIPYLWRNSTRERKKRKENIRNWINKGEFPSNNFTESKFPQICTHACLWVCFYFKNRHWINSLRNYKNTFFYC